MPKYADSNAIDRWKGYIVDEIDEKIDLLHEHGFVNGYRIKLSNTVPATNNQNVITFYCPNLPSNAILPDVTDPTEYAQPVEPEPAWDFVTVYVDFIDEFTGNPITSAMPGDTGLYYAKFDVYVEFNEYSRFVEYVYNNSDISSLQYSDFGLVVSTSLDGGSNWDWDSFFITMTDNNPEIIYSQEDPTVIESIHMSLYYPSDNQLPYGVPIFENIDAEQLLAGLMVKAIPALANTNTFEIYIQAGDQVVYRVPYDLILNYQGSIFDMSVVFPDEPSPVQIDITLISSVDEFRGTTTTIPVSNSESTDVILVIQASVNDLTQLSNYEIAIFNKAYEGNPVLYEMGDVFYPSGYNHQRPTADEPVIVSVPYEEWASLGYPNGGVFMAALPDGDIGTVDPYLMSGEWDGSLRDYVGVNTLLIQITDKRTDTVILRIPFDITTT